MVNLLRKEHASVDVQYENDLCFILYFENENLFGNLFENAIGMVPHSLQPSKAAKPATGQAYI